MSKHLPVLSKFIKAVLSFFGEDKSKKDLLDDVNAVCDYFENDPDIANFFISYGIRRDQKKEVLNMILKHVNTNEILNNSLNIMIDRGMSSSIRVFLNTLRSCLLDQLNIKNIFVYSSFPIIDSQKKRIEELWREKLKNKVCKFHYLLDSSLRLGIKIQAGMYIEEYSLNSNFNNLKIKLDSIFI